MSKNQQSLFEKEEAISATLNNQSAEGQVFLQSIEYTLEYKFDGLGVELIYKNGEFKQAITRGNGIEGEDITENVRTIKNIPHKIDFKDDLEVRGEVIMPISVFGKLNEELKEKGEKIFSNPRNSASGSLRQKDANITKERGLKFFAYDLANFQEFSGKIGEKKYFQVIKKLEGFGFEISPYFEIFPDIEGVINAIENFGDRKKSLDFDVDGLVVKMNDISLWEEVGWTEHHPRYAIAYKFPAEILTTKILSVDRQVGKTGTITPVANLEPVNIGGVIVKRATLHNYEEVAELGIKVGDMVFVKRAGEVIPKIISVAANNGGEDILPPEFCPSCGTRIIKDEDKVRFYCPNHENCPAQHIEKLIFAVGKQGFNIDGFGKKQVELFLKEGIIQNLVDIFKINTRKNDILQLEGFKEKSVSNLINGVEKAKNQSINSFLTALGIEGIGKKTAKIISPFFTSKEDLVNFSHTIEELEEINEVGPEIAKNVFEYFQNSANKKILEELTGILNIKYYEPYLTSPYQGEEQVEMFGQNIFTGKKVCITGSFEQNGEKISRDDLVEKLEEVGGTFVSSISKNTDFLLMGENAGSKKEKAEKLGVKIIDLEEFLENLRSKI